MATKNTWDTELYEAQHSFVWRYGRDLIDLLDPKPGERILDLGCGTGHLTSEIARRGAAVVGLDSSPDMIGQARQHYPGLLFTLADAASMSFDCEFDAVFSNAALHWMLDSAAVAAAISRALNEGGRLVLECGGRGNIARIEEAIHSVWARLGQPLPPSRTVFHSIAGYSSILEAAGLEVRSALLFDRPTPLEGSRGMEQWLRQFSAYYFDSLPPALRAEAYSAVVETLRPLLFRDQTWYADYRRLRVVASKPRREVTGTL